MSRAKNILQGVIFFAAVLLSTAAAVAGPTSRLLYVAAPGIRNYLAYGGAGILVFDIDNDHLFVRRIETSASRVESPENIKGICASAATGKLYFSTPTKLYCLELTTDRELWQIAPPGGCDRMSILPDGKLLYVPSFEGSIWNVIDGATGGIMATIRTDSRAHNTICGQSGQAVYLAGLGSPVLSVADARKHRVVRGVGSFSAEVRPFTVDGAERRAFVCVNRLLGFEIGDIPTGKVTARVAVAGYSTGKVQRHGCPSHGIGLTPDEKEIWLCDSANRRLHVFDVTVEEPRQVASIALRDEPGWVTFSLDGKIAYSLTGEVIDVGSKRIVAALKDELGRDVQSEKLLEIDFADGKPLKAGDQFGVGRMPYLAR